MCLKTKLLITPACLREMTLFHDFYLLRIFRTKRFQTDITKLYFWGKNYDPTLFQGLLVQNRNLSRPSLVKKTTITMSTTSFSGASIDLPWLMQNKEAPTKGGGGVFEANHKPFLKKEIYGFTLIRLSYLSRSLRSSLSFSSNSCFALEIHSSSVFMLSSDRELKYFF